MSNKTTAKKKKPAAAKQVAKVTKKPSQRHENILSLLRQ